MVTQMFFIAHLMAVVSYFECYESPNGGKAIRSYPYAECYSSDYWTLFPVAACGVLVNVVAVFAVFAWLVVVAPALYPINKAFRIRIKFLVFKWHPATWYYSCPTLVRTTLICIVSVIAPNSGFLQCVLMEMILI